MPDSERDFLAEYLAERDEPCPSCRYSLKGLQGSVCPECGQALTLRVGLVEPRLAAWVFGLVGISAGFGTSVLLGTYFALMLVRHGWLTFSGMEAAFTLLASGVPVGATMLGLWLRFRGRICRSGARTRWMLGAVLSMLTLAFPIGFLALVD